jgi:sodium/bile acid cotransporter 7
LDRELDASLRWHDGDIRPDPSLWHEAAMLKNLIPDRFTLMLLASVGLASVLPVHGWATPVFDVFTNIAIAALFFLHGAKLSRKAVLAGMTNWCLHLVVLASTFVLFPVLALLLRPLLAPLVTPELYAGVVFLCLLPSTVQSSIAFTSIARGNVPAAVCSASASNLIGIFLTPLLVSLLMTSGQDSGLSFSEVGNIVLLLLVPFAAGQLAQRFIGGFVRGHPSLVGFVDQGSILLIVYTAFSASVVQGLWRHTPWQDLLGLIAICAVLLAIVLAATCYGSRLLGFNKEDEITIVFCGSKKTLASGIPMAKVIFGTHGLGAIILPLMLFHQFQLMVCAVIARHYARCASIGGGQSAGEARADLGACPVSKGRHSV